MIENTHGQIATEDLPLWMRRARESVDWGILFVLAISALVGWGFVLQPSLPHTNMSENYVYMTHNYAETLTEGRFYPRWNTYANLGYGAPTPHYNPPLAPYSSAIIQLFFTGDSVSAVRVAYFLSMCLAGAMTYAFVLRESGARAAIIASTAYVYSPYVGLTAPYIIGDLQTVMALALFPMFLWSMNRLLKINAPADFAFAVFSISALVLIGLEYLLGALILIIVLLLHHLIKRQLNFKHIIRPLVGTVFFSATLTSFYWVPFILEYNAVIWHPPVITPEPLALTLERLIAPLSRIDLNELLPTPQYTLGLPVIALSLLSIGTIFHRWYTARTLTYTLEITCFLAGILTLIALIQIPVSDSWIIGIVALNLGISSGGIIALRKIIPANIQRVFAPMIVTILIISALPVWLIPTWQSNFGATGVEAQIQHELNGFGIATVPAHQAIPTTHAEELPLNTALFNGYISDTINRITQAQMTTGRTLDVLNTDSHEDSFQICVTQTSTFRVLRSFFEGWTVTLEDAPATALNPNTNRLINRPCQQVVTGDTFSSATLERNTETGLIDVIIPGEADTRLMTIALNDTPPRRAGWIISWITFGILLSITIIRVRRQKPLSYEPFQMMDKLEARLLLVIVISLAISILLFASPLTQNSLHAQPGHTLNGTIASPAHRTDEGINLISYEFNQTNATADDEIDIYLAWRTSERLNENFRVQLHLRDTNQGLRWTETAIRHPGNLPTRRWGPGFFISDRHTLHIPDSIVPGEYEIVIELYVCEPQCLSSRRVTFFQANQANSQQFILPTRIRIQ